MSAGSQVPPTDPTPGSNSGAEQTLLIIVGVSAGTLFLVVMILLGIVVWLYYRKDRKITTNTDNTEQVFDNRHRLFREPTNFGSKFADLQELEKGSVDRDTHRNSGRSGSIRSTRSTRSNRSANSTRSNGKNPTFGRDEEFADVFNLKSRSRRQPSVTSNEEFDHQNGIENPAIDISDEQSNTSSPQLSSISNSETGKPSQPEDGDNLKPGPKETDMEIFAISGSKDSDFKDHVYNEDDEDDNAPYDMYSPFQRENPQRRRSFKSKNSAVIDFYEGGTLGGADTVTGTSRTHAVSDPFWDGFGETKPDENVTGGAGSLLWQTKRIF